MDNKFNNKISVVIPTYNRVEFICEAIDSVLNQTLKAHEIIIVDDGSNDNTEEIVIKKYNDHVKYIKKKNGGPSSSRNFGMKYATGDYIAFLDSDDIWYIDKLEKQMNLFHQNNNIYMTFTGTEQRNHNLNQIIGYLCINPSFRNNMLYNILKYCIIITSSVIIKKSITNTIGYFNESLLIGEDWEYFSRITSQCSVDYISEPLMISRKHPGSIKADIDRWVIEDLKSMDIMLSFQNEYKHELLKYHKYRIYSEAGINYFYIGNHLKARSYFLKALKYSINPELIKYLTKTIIPYKILQYRRKQLYKDL